MPLPSHPVLVFAKSAVTAPSGSDEIDGINSVSYSPSVDLLDITDFKDTSGAKLKMAALQDGSISLSGDLELADAPQSLLRTSMASGASVWITIHFNPSASAGSKGFQVECKVESFEMTVAVDGKNEFSASLQFTGVPTTA
jgi:predicted secreted protein